MTRPGVEFSPTTRRAIYERDGFRCVRCGRYFPEGRGLDAHHRQLRSQGGMGVLDNGISLCGSGTTGCHGWVHAHPAAAYAAGWLVHSWDDPADIPWDRWDTMRAEAGEDRPGEPFEPSLDLSDGWNAPGPSEGLPRWTFPG